MACTSSKGTNQTADADLDLYWMHMLEDTLSLGATHITKQKKYTKIPNEHRNHTLLILNSDWYYINLEKYNTNIVAYSIPL